MCELLWMQGERIKLRQMDREAYEVSWHLRMGVCSDVVECLSETSWLTQGQARE